MVVAVVLMIDVDVERGGGGCNAAAKGGLFRPQRRYLVVL